MNFIEEYKKGQAGGNKGLPMGEGIENVARAINGVQKGRIYGVAAPSKCGKSTLVDYGFVIHPYLYCLENNISIDILYFSFELDRVGKEFDFVAFFLFYDYGITHVGLEEGQTLEGKTEIPLSSNYLRGRLQDDEGKIIKVKQKIYEVIQVVYKKRIIPLFGEYGADGTLMKKGRINFIEQKENPTGIYKYLKRYAERNGKFVKDPRNENRIIGYKPKNASKYVIIITDHLRKLIPERGWQMKQTVDKYIEYSVELRNWCQFTFVHIIHTNRNITSQERLRFSKDLLYPSSEDIKDTGNLAEDADYVFTMFNPSDDRYNLKEHFGIKIKDDSGNELFPNMRTIHLVESRHCHYPQHFKTNMIGNYKNFEKLDI